MKWISVKDQMPDMDKYVLVSGVYRLDVHGLFIAKYIIRRGNPYWQIFMSGCECCLDDFSNVTHWMPLPEGPKD